MSAIKKALRIARSRRKKYAEGGGAFGVYSPGEQAEVDKTDPMSMSVGKSSDDTPTRFKTASPMVNITDQDIDRGVNVGMGAGPGIFVGPYGATRLRNMAREAGDSLAEGAMVHPVVRRNIRKELDSLPPEVREAHAHSIQAEIDDWARSTLEGRAAKGDFRDRDVFQRSGWSFTADGKPAKEIPDTGTTVKPIEGLPGKYSLEHPAGDLHKVYDLPPIQVGGGPKDSEAYFRARPMAIGVESEPTKNVSNILHEVQHGISYREGWPRGSNPLHTPSGINERELFKSHPLPEYQKDLFMKADAKGLSRENLDMFQSDPTTAKLAAYLHSAGENQSFNVQARRKHPQKYLTHPEDTEVAPRPFQYNEYTPTKQSGRIPVTESAAKFDFPKGYHEKVPGEQRMAATGISHPGARWEVYDPQTGAVQSTQLTTRRGASRSQDRLDNKYGGYRYQVRPVAPKQLTEEEAKFLKENGIDFGDNKYAGGGGVGNFNPERASAFGLARQGQIKSTVPGRTDKLELNVPTGSYIIPADVPSALGQGNSDAGSAILNKMFNSGPYGMALPRAKGGMRVGSRKSSLTKIKTGFADGGEAQDTPIVAAGGEYVIHPETVASLGNGDIDLGHSILDAFVKQTRAKHITTLKGLKPPKGS